LLVDLLTKIFNAKLTIHIFYKREKHATYYNSVPKEFNYSAAIIGEECTDFIEIERRQTIEIFTEKKRRRRRFDSRANIEKKFPLVKVT
jgi:hypothetical protein